MADYVNKVTIINEDGSVNNRDISISANKVPVTKIGDATAENTQQMLEFLYNRKTDLTGFLPTENPEATGSLGLNRDTSVSIGDGSIALGTGSKAVGENSYSIGQNASSNNSFSIGLSAKSSDGGYAIGSGAEAKFNSVVVGLSSNATSNGLVFGHGNTAASTSAAIGFDNTSTNSSIVIGHGSEASFNNFILGSHCEANLSNHKVVVGSYNKEIPNTEDSKIVFEIGGGADDGERKTVFYVDNRGIATATGDVVIIDKEDNELSLGQAAEIVKELKPYLKAVFLTESVVF